MRGVRTIKVSLIEGTREIEAVVVGKFAAHPSWLQPIDRDNAKAWHTVTHLATGLSIAGASGRTEAKRLARQLDAVITADITARDYAARNKRYKAFASAVRPVLEAAGIGLEVA